MSLDAPVFFLDRDLGSKSLLPKTVSWSQSFRHLEELR